MQPAANINGVELYRISGVNCRRVNHVPLLSADVESVVTGQRCQTMYKQTWRVFKYAGLFLACFFSSPSSLETTPGSGEEEEDICIPRC